MSAPAAPRPTVLFAEDFDALAGAAAAPDDAAEPEVIAPVSPADAAAAREQAYAEGFRNGLAQATNDRAEIGRQLLAAIADRMADADAVLREAVEAAAEDLARLLLASLGAALPTLRRRFGGVEVARVAREVLPGLAREARITIRLSPLVRADLDRELARLDPDLAARIAIVPTDTVAPGDVRISWQDGTALRDGAQVWAGVVETLASLGLGDLAARDLAAAAAD
jgi:flagellar biosynthesis/type III secretory pathway protein FliH